MGVRKKGGHGVWVFVAILALLIGYGLGHYDGKKDVTFTPNCENRFCGNETDCTGAVNGVVDCQRDLDNTRNNLAGCDEALQDSEKYAKEKNQEINVLEQRLRACSNLSGAIYGCKETVTNSGMFVPDNCMRIQ